MESTGETAKDRRAVTVALWSARAAWFATALLAGPGLEDALAVEPASLRATATVGLWGAWAALLVATLVPRPVTLTAVRIGGPTGVAVTGWAAVAAGGDVLAVVAVAVAAAVTVVLFLPAIGDLFVDGSSYGSERRFALRAPGVLLLGPAPLAAVVVVAGAAAGPLLLAAHRWVLGGVLTALGLPLAALAVRSLHGLARRWIVFVPAGLVLHDPMALAEPVLFPRRTVRGLRAAPANTTARDLTLGAPGLALELRADDATSVELGPLARESRREVTLDAVLFTPSRPGALLDEAATRRFRTS